VTARRGIFVAPFGELSEPRRVAELAALAEERGWDGFFVWDHVAYRPPVRELADPWVTLAAVAMTTSRVVIGPLVTPIPRRRPHQLARETVTLDRLSGGRLVLGVGIGSDSTGEFAPGFLGEEPSMRERARLLDEGLERLVSFWGGEFEPLPVQRPRIPVWVASIWPARRPMRRAARWDGWFPISVPSPEDLAAGLAEVGRGDGFEVIVTNEAGVDPAPWAAAGATWCLTGFGREPGEAEVRAAIEAGP
jgi:alkanesulfonate monooxygenase SsuD/methylene tetrahydromethanopterin reductase-like flavin-dependent oxidoreductase (luciferase family)